MVKESVESLKKILDYHDNLYYNQDTSEISDAEYDVLKNRYLELTETNEYDYVPGSAQFGKIEHTSPILSLDKVQITDIEKLRSEIKRLWPISIEPKYDGLTIVAYPNGKFVSRGNGKIGEDCTSHCMQIECLKECKPNTDTYRMEVLMTVSEFNRLNEERIRQEKKPFENPRNAAAGMLRNKDVKKVEGLTAFIYDIVGSRNPHVQDMERLSDIYDNITPYWEFNDSNYQDLETGVQAAIDFILNFDRTELDYDIDGLVIKSNRSNSLEYFGMTGHHPKNAIAVKFEAEGEWTQVIDVTWSVGKTGLITPVVELAPVNILGSTISRATMHNIGIMEGLGLDRILVDNKHKTYAKVVKANDVIPKVIEVRHDKQDEPNSYGRCVSVPSSCPVCGAETERVGDLLFCTGDACRAQLAGKISVLASRDALNVEGLSDATIDKMIEYAIANSIPLDFTLPFYFTLDDILALPGFKDKSAEKLYNRIQQARKTELKRFIYAANIPLIGRSASEAIASNLLTVNSLIEEIMNNNMNKIASIDGFGSTMIASLRKHAAHNMELLFNHVKPMDEEANTITHVPNEILTFVITGSFDEPRKTIEEIIKGAGHKVSGSVSKKTSYLLAALGEEGTTKYKKAIEENITIIRTIQELNELLELE